MAQMQPLGWQQVFVWEEYGFMMLNKHNLIIFNMDIKWCLFHLIIFNIHIYIYIYTYCHIFP